MWGLEHRLSWRVHGRTPGFLAAALLSLAIGEAAALLLIAFVRFHERFNYWIPDHDRVVAVRFHRVAAVRENLLMMFTAAPRVAAGELEHRFPLIRTAGWLGGQSPVFVDQTGRRLPFHARYADPHLLSVLGLRLLAGDAETALAQAGGIVLTRHMAQALFGTDSPLGRTVATHQKGPLKVTGVMADLPPDTHLDFDALIAAAGLPAPKQPWGWQGTSEDVLYIKLARPMPPEELAGRLAPFVRQRMPATDPAHPVQIDVCTLRELHIGKDYQPADMADLERRNCSFTSSVIAQSWLETLTAIAGVIALLGAVNAAMLLIAQSLRRSREVALKRLLGAGRAAIARGFLREGITLGLMAALLAAVFAGLAREQVKVLLGASALPLFADPGGLAWLVGLALASGLTAGLYPAVFAGFLRPELLFRKDREHRGGGLVFFLLALVQTAAAVGFVLAAVLAGVQLAHLRAGDLGFAHRDVLLVGPAPDEAGTLIALRHRLAGDPDITGLALAEAGPGEPYFNFVQPMRDGHPVGRSALYGRIERTMLTTLALRPVAVSADMRARLWASDPASQEAVPADNFVVTENAVREMGFDSPEAALDQPIALAPIGGPGKPVTGRILAVVRDLRAHGFTSQARRIFRIVPLDAFAPARTGARVMPTHLYLRARPGRIAALGTRLQAMLEREFPLAEIPVAPLSRSVFATLHDSETLRRLLLAAGVLAALLGAIGIAGFAALAVHRSRQALAIHRLAGASDRAIGLRITLRILRPVLLGLPLGLAGAVLFFLDWRQKFVLQSPLPVPLVLLVAAAALTLALLVNAGQIWRVLRLRPVTVLREP